MVQVVRRIKAEQRFRTGQRSPILDIKPGKIVVVRRKEPKERPMCGYQYHPPRKRLRDKLREIWRILRE